MASFVYSLDRLRPNWMEAIKHADDLKNNISPSAASAAFLDTPIMDLIGAPAVEQQLGVGIATEVARMTSAATLGVASSDVAVEIAKASIVVLSCLFMVLAVLTIKQLWKMIRPVHAPMNAMLSPPVSMSFTGEKTRATFMTFLAVANIVRAASLVFLLFDTATYMAPVLLPSPRDTYNRHHHLDASGDSSGSPLSGALGSKLWSVTVMQSLPALLFLTTYSIVIFFWTQIYYTARFVSLPFLRPGVVCLNLAVYVFYAVIAFLTWLLSAYLEFRSYATALVAVLYIVTALLFCLLGFKIAFHFSGEPLDSEQEMRNSAVVRRVLSLSICCPILLLVRGLNDLGYVLTLIPEGIGSNIMLPISWDCAIIFLSEWLPALLTLLSFWPSSKNRIGGARMSQMGRPQIFGNGIGNEMAAPLLSSSSAQHNKRGTLTTVGHDGNDTNDNDVLNKCAPNHIYPVGASSPISMPNMMSPFTHGQIANQRVPHGWG